MRPMRTKPQGLAYASRSAASSANRYCTLMALKLGACGAGVYLPLPLPAAPALPAAAAADDDDDEPGLGLRVTTCRSRHN
jgi:hypothetical protein